ncbi:MAG: ATP synthase F0 subunit B [Pseudomonadota bacterium]
MSRKQKKDRKIISLFIFFVIFSFVGFAFAVTGGAPFAAEHGSSGESVQESKQEASTESGQGEGHGGDRSADLLDLLYRFINFTLLVIILVVVIKKSGLKDSLMGRIEEIRQKLENLKKEKEASQIGYQEIEEKLRKFEAEKEEIIEQFKKEGLAEKERIIAEAKERANQIVAQAELNIQQEIEVAKKRLKREVGELAAQRAQDIISKEITEKDQERLVDEFIERVGKIH